MYTQVRFRTTCAECGDVAVDPVAVALVLDAEMSQLAYEFQCPSCLESLRAPATQATAEVLIGLGAEVSLLDADPDSALPSPR